MAYLESEHPLQQTFQRIQERNEYIKGQFGLPAEDNWSAPVHFFQPDSPRFKELAAQVEQLYKTNNANAIAAVMLQSYQWPLISTAMAAYLLDRRVPTLAVENVRMLVSAEGEVDQIAYGNGRFAALPDDPAADHPDAVIVPDLVALRELLRTGLETHLGWVIKQFSELLQSKERPLWPFVTDRCVSTLSWLMQEWQSPLSLAEVQQEIDALIQVPGSPLSHKKLNLFELSYKEHTHIYMDRLTCCYWYRRPDGHYCSTCPHIRKEERIERLRQYLVKQYEN
jgi:ferric iron reductase protein FhuF